MNQDVRVNLLNTYFLFPFAVDKEAVAEDHQAIWCKHPQWIAGLEEWVRIPHITFAGQLLEALGPWKRSPYKRFDMDSVSYQDMVFFHPYVRRVFFDCLDLWGEGSDRESLLHFYRIPLEGKQLWFEAEDAKGRKARLEVTDLKLNMYANGIGTLAIGVEARDLSLRDALWINEMVRKIHPSSRRQIREGRMPCRLAFVLDRPTASGETLSQTLVEERFEEAAMVGFQPPLAKTVQALLYFADYAQREYEPVLDERMVVYTYLELSPVGLPEGYLASEEYQQLLSHVLYVDRLGSGFRYDREFIRGQMDRQLYKRWSHQGTYYGFTTYSNVTVCIGSFECGEHKLDEGFLIYRMFMTRYLLMAQVTLFYRATLLDFAERTALVSRRLHQDQGQGRISTENIKMAAELRADFLHFSNYWYFDELANKDEESEHFAMQVREYRIDSMKREIEEEIDKLNESIHTYYQFRNTEAINRVAMLSLILGAGAVATGFFGMNFEGQFAATLFKETREHWLSIAFVSVFSVLAIGFGIFVVLSHWADYRESLLPRWWLARKLIHRSLKRG
jgi:hypothetical protein